MKRITVLLSDDHTLVREGLRRILETDPEIEVVGEASNGQESVREAKRLKPNVVLQDMAMPLLNGLVATRQIAKEAPSTKVLILSAYANDEYIENAIEAGATGYLLKEAVGNDLLRAIREIAKGNAYFSPAITRRLLKQWQGKGANGHAVRTKAKLLTSRQTEVLQLIAEGYATKQIADVFSLTVKTVEKHRQDLMNTLNIHNIATLTRYAVSSGVVESNRVPLWPVSPSRNEAPTEQAA